MGDATVEVGSSGAMGRSTTGSGKMAKRKEVVSGKDRERSPMWASGKEIPSKDLEYCQKRGAAMRESSKDL